MTPWGWRERRPTSGSRALVRRALGPLAAAVPWVTVALLFQMIVLMGGALTAAEGALFALPERPETIRAADIGESSLVALLQPTRHGTLVFFDDTRFVLDDDVQMERFAEQLRARVRPSGDATLIALADMRLAWGDLYRFRGYARAGGADRILFAERTGRAAE